jgi:hypothetical protein
MAIVRPVVEVKSGTFHAATRSASAQQGSVGPSGRRVRDVLEEAKGAGDKLRISFDEKRRRRLEQLGRLPGNEQLLQVAADGYYDVDVSSLRSADPDASVIVGLDISCTPEEAQQLGLA